MNEFDDFQSNHYSARCFLNGEDNKQSFCLKPIVKDYRLYLELPKENGKELVECPSTGRVLYFMYKEKHLEVVCPNIDRFIDQYQKTLCKDDCN